MPNKLFIFLESKHPVSMLMEVCSANRWPDPLFEIVDESGPAHMRNFLMRCVLNNCTYLPHQPSPNKKLAKASASLACLKALGLA